MLAFLALIFAFRLANLITPFNMEKIVSQKVGSYDVSFLKIKVNQPYLPSYWVAKVFQQALISINFTGFAYIFGLTLLALTLLALVSSAGGALYLSVWQRVYELASRPAKIKRSRLNWFKSAKGTIVERDLRLFSRNPDEIYQAVFIFLVVLLFLFIISKLPYLDITQPLWRYRLALLLAGTISYFLAMLANRFVYPALSLEGRSFWLLLGAPFSLKDFYLSKLLAALTFAFLFVTVLFSLAAYYFVLPFKLGLLMYLQTLTAAFTIVVLNLSLGSLYPDFTRRSAAEISSSLPALLAAVFSIIYGVLGMLSLRPLARHFFLTQAIDFSYYGLFLLLSLALGILLLVLSLKKLTVFSL
jgi:ABC-2 type transport system permease protein